MSKFFDFTDKTFLINLEGQDVDLVLLNHLFYKNDLYGLFVAKEVIEKYIENNNIYINEKVFKITPKTNIQGEYTPVLEVVENVTTKLAKLIDKSKEDSEKILNEFINQRKLQLN